MSKQEPSGSFHSETHVFDPVEYVRAYYSGPDNFPCPQEKEVVEWSVDKIQGMFVGGRYRGATLLDIGTGPVVYTVITASQWFDEVFLSDVSKDNVAFLRKWLAKDSEATEAMRYQMGYFAQKEGKGTSWEIKNEQVRMKVKDAIVWDMNKPRMLKGTALDGVLNDFVIASLCMCTSSSTISGYTGIIKNIGEMLKPGGHFVIIDVMDQTSYFVDDVKFSLLRVTEDEIKTAFLQNGFEIEQFESHSLAIYPNTELSDAQTVYFIVGKKM